MMEQLDMTGRTGELARAFGIDFFSVLTRGSQYRVEAMMVRLAHTQNYVLPAPSKQQVPTWHTSVIHVASCTVLSSFRLEALQAHLTGGALVTQFSCTMSCWL